MDIVYFDLQKAFDEIPHHVLLTNLSSFGICDVVVSWIKEYLTARTMCVHVGSSVSRSFDVTSGIPQGSILGPFLFKFQLFSSPIFRVAKLLKLADDCKLYVAFNKND